MGSFSLSCGVTGLSITAGDKCVMLPITANVSPFLSLNGPKVVPKATMRTSAYIVYNSDLWVPAMLPIHGEYDDYGGLEEIIEDDNTRVLEERYGLTIEEIISIICDGRNDLYDSYSETYEVFFGYKDEYEELFSRRISIEDAAELFEKRKKFIESLGIKQCDITFQEDSFMANWRDVGSRTYKYDGLLDFLSYHYNTTGEIVGVKEDRVEVCRELMCTGAMFVLEEVWQQFATDSSPKDSIEYLSCCVSEGFLLNIGLVRAPNDDSKYLFLNDNGDTIGYVDIYSKEVHSDGASGKYYYVKEFIKQAKKLVGIDFKKQCDKLYKGCDCFTFSKKNFIACLDKGTFVKDNPQLERIQKMDIVPQMHLAGNPRTAMIDSIYQDELCNYLCIEEYFAMLRFCSASYLLNVVWMPPFSGSQCGCLEAEAKRAYITSKIVKDRIADRDYDDEDKPDDDEEKRCFWKSFY